MSKENNHENEILYTFMKLNDEFPELSKFIKTIEKRNNDEDQESVNLKKLVPYLESLEQLMKEYRLTDNGNKLSNLVKFKLDGYPVEPPTEDIYNKVKKGMDLNPKDLSKDK